MVDACRACANCRKGWAQYCDTGSTCTHNEGGATTARPPSAVTPKKIVVSQDFVLRIPDGLDPAAAAPLLCAGIPGHQRGLQARSPQRCQYRFLIDMASLKDVA